MWWDRNINSLIFVWRKKPWSPTQRLFNEDQEETFLTKLFAAFLPTEKIEQAERKKDFSGRKYRTVRNNDYIDMECYRYLAESYEAGALRDHMASFPRQYNPPVGKFWKQVVDQTNEANRLWYKYYKCRNANYYSTGKTGPRRNVDHDHITGRYANFGPEIEEMKRTGELDKAKQYLGCYKEGKTVGVGQDNFHFYDDPAWMGRRN